MNTSSALPAPLILPAGWTYVETGGGCSALTDGRWLIVSTEQASAPTRNDEPVTLAMDGDSGDCFGLQCASVSEAIAIATAPLPNAIRITPADWSDELTQHGIDPSDLQTGDSVWFCVWPDGASGFYVESSDGTLCATVGNESVTGTHEEMQRWLRPRVAR